MNAKTLLKPSLNWLAVFIPVSFPFLVLMSYAFGHPINLEFTMAEIVAIGAAAVVTTQIAQDGQSNWLNGLQMLVVYTMIAVLFFFLPT